VCKLAHTSSSSITPADTTYWDDKTLGDMIASLNLYFMKKKLNTKIFKTKGEKNE
jgi:hypothetical protein